MPLKRESQVGGVSRAELGRAAGMVLGLFAALLAAPGARGQSHTNVQTVFFLVMENVNWPTLKTNLGSAPYLVNTLLPMASFCEQYYTPPGLPGSLPNYFWLEAG